VAGVLCLTSIEVSLFEFVDLVRQEVCDVPQPKVQAFDVLHCSPLSSASVCCLPFCDRFHSLRFLRSSLLAIASSFFKAALNSTPCSCDDRKSGYTSKSLDGIAANVDGSAALTLIYSLLELERSIFLTLVAAVAKLLRGL
jgi:hypothetical protein